MEFVMMFDALLHAACLPAYLRVRTAAIPGTLSRAGRRVWRLLEEYGQRRGRHHVLQVALRCEAVQPGLAQELRAAACHAVERDDGSVMR
jgi:hypothetical protein